MVQDVFRGGRRYWSTLGLLGLVVLIGLLAYARQLREGLQITGMGRDVSWGLYISQFTFLVGVAASAVMVVLPYYLHHYKAFAKTVILGEFLAVSAVLMCMLFVFVDMGQPGRLLNILLYPQLHSIMFWDLMVLTGYLGLNLVIGTVTIEAERLDVAPPRWIRPLIYVSIPWAVSIHTVTAFLYAGLKARPFWMTAILAPRFLASAFASGPSLLILLALLLRRTTKFDVGREAISKLAVIVTYAMVVNLFFVLVELFTILYGGVPHDVESVAYLFTGLGGRAVLTPWVWVGEWLTVVTVTLLLLPGVRARDGALALVCAGVVAAIWIEKGLAMVVTGFIPTPLGHVTQYVPTLPEVAIALGIYALGGFTLTVLYKLVLGVRARAAVA